MLLITFTTGFSKVMLNNTDSQTKQDIFTHKNTEKLLVINVP